MADWLLHLTKSMVNLEHLSEVGTNNGLRIFLDASLMTQVTWEVMALGSAVYWSFRRMNFALMLQKSEKKQLGKYKILYIVG